MVHYKYKFSFYRPATVNCNRFVVCISFLLAIFATSFKTLIIILINKKFMVKRMRSFFAVVMLVIAATVNAQVTTSSMSGKVVDQSNEAIIGATIQAIHEPVRHPLWRSEERRVGKEC